MNYAAYIIQVNMVY